jgi:predicted neutral ceramidase superfamily lipid hydrolase
MEPGFREDIIMALRKQGYDQAEVMTTDTHAVNAVALSNKGYPPVGRQRRQEILQHILIASEKAKASLQPVTVGLGFGKLTGITVYGEKGFDVLTEDVTEAAHAAKRVGPSSAGVALLLSLLMTLLL